MKVSQVILQLQSLLLIPDALQSPRIGPLTRGAFERLALAQPDIEWVDINRSASEDKSLGHPGASDREITQRGLDFIKEFEGLYLKAYDDGGGVMTIGWGHTGLQHDDGTVYAGRTITREKAEQLLRYDLNQFEARVSAMVKRPLTDDQFAALVSFDFNTGGLAKSTLLRKLNEGDTEGALGEFQRWNKDNGREIPGLTRRRRSEVRLFQGATDPVVV